MYIVINLAWKIWQNKVLFYTSFLCIVLWFLRPFSCVCKLCFQYWHSMMIILVYGNAEWTISLLFQGRKFSFDPCGCAFVSVPGIRPDNTSAILVSNLDLLLETMTQVLIFILILTFYWKPWHRYWFFSSLNFIYI